MIKLRQALGILKLSFKSMFAYRFEFLVWAILHPIYILMSYFLWKAIYATTTVVRVYTFNEMMTYLIFGTLIGVFTWNNLDMRLGHEVCYGHILTEITKPIKTFYLKVLKDAGYIPIALVLQVIPLFLIAVFVFNFKFSSLILAILFCISVILAMILSYSITFTFGLSSFWLKRYSGLGRVRIGLTEVLSGILIPLTLFPLIVQKILMFLPFQYISFIPIQIALGKFSILETIMFIGIQVLWIIVLQVMISIIWKRGIHRFAGVGT